jgi:hypothetical protein
MKRLALLLLVLMLIVVLFWWWRRPVADDDPPLQTAACVTRAEEMALAWSKEGKSDEEITRLFQIELARCSGVEQACAPFVAAVNVDYAWLGRQVLSGAMSPVDYLARVRDRSRKLRQSRQSPDVCNAYTAGDADADLVPDDRDKCAGTPNFEATGPDGCPDPTPPPPAPTREAVDNAAKALKIPLTRACQQAAVPEGAAVLRFGLDPADEQSFLIEVTRVANQPADCPVFYEIEGRIRNSSFFSGSATQEAFRRVYRAADTVPNPGGATDTLTFRIRQMDPVPWNALVRSAVEPSDRATKSIRVRSVNGNGSSPGWSSFRIREFRPFNRNFE